MKLNNLVIGMAIVFDDTVSGMVKIFDFGGAIANVNKLSTFGREYKVASLMVELSLNDEIEEETFNNIINSTYEGSNKIETMRISLKKQFTQ